MHQLRHLGGKMSVRIGLYLLPLLLLWVGQLSFTADANANVAAPFGEQLTLREDLPVFSDIRLNSPAVAGGLSMNTSLSPGSIAPGGGSLLTFALENVDSGPHSGVTFTATLPLTLRLIEPIVLDTDCDATLELIGQTTVVLSEGRLGIGSRCTVTLGVTGDTLGTFTIPAAEFRSDAGDHTAASVDLAIEADRPTFSLIAQPTQISVGGVSRLIYTVNNGTNPSFAIGPAFSHSLPNGLVVATPANGTTDCPGSITAEPDAAKISGSASLLNAGDSCTFGVDVLAEAAGTYNLATSQLIGNSKSSGNAQAALTVNYDVLNKAFVTDPVGAGGEVTLRYTLSNLDRADQLSQITFSDDLNGALSGLVATGLPLNDVCGAGSSVSGSGIVTLSNGQLDPEESCTFDITLAVPVSAASGVYTSTSSTISALRDGPFTGNQGTDYLVISPLPTIETVFSPALIEAGESTTIQFTITNGSSQHPITDLSFIDNTSRFLSGSTLTALPATGFCGTGSTLSIFEPVSGEPAIGLFNGSISTGSSCTFTATLQTPSSVGQGIYTNETEALKGTINGVVYEGFPSTSTLEVVAPPKLQAYFAESPVLPGETADLVYRIEYAVNGDSAGLADASAIEFTHDLGAMLSGLEASGTPLLDNCGSGAALTGSSSLTFSGGQLAAGGRCTITVTTQIPAAAPSGDYFGSTSPLLVDINGVSLEGEGVSVELGVTTLSFEKSFAPANALPGGDVTVTYVIRNQSATEAATGLSFTDSLSTLISGASSTSGTLNDICGGGSALSGTTFLIFTGGNLAPLEQCSFSVTVSMPGGASNGTYGNPTSSLSGTIGGSLATLDPATAILEINSSRLALVADFESPTSLPGVVGTLVYTLTNIDLTHSIDQISFSTLLDAGVTGLAASNTPQSNVCGSGSTLSGSGTVVLTGGSLAAGGSCTFSLQVAFPSGAAAGNYEISSSLLSGEIGGIGVDGPAEETDIQISELTVSHSFAEPAAPNTVVPLTFLFESSVLGEVQTGLTFSSDLDALIPGMIHVGGTLQDVCGDGSVVSGTSTITLTNGTIREFGSCTFTLEVKLPKEVDLDTYVYTLSSLYRNGVMVSQPVSSTLQIVRPDVTAEISHSNNGAEPLLPGEGISYTVTITNVGAGTATDIYIDNPIPAAVKIDSILTDTVPITLTQTTRSTGYRLEIGDMTAGLVETIVLNGQIDPDLNSGASISQTTTISATADTSTLNNSATVGTFSISVPQVEAVSAGSVLTVAEESGVVSLPLALEFSNPHAPVNIIYSTVQGSATGGVDYAAVTLGTFSIPAGSTNGSISIPITNDDQVEADETFEIRLSSATGGQLSGITLFEVTIVSDDVAENEEENNEEENNEENEEEEAEDSIYYFFPLFVID